MGGISRFTRNELLELQDIGGLEVRPEYFRFGPYISGIEVNQAIQYYKASRHLTDSADRGPDNSVALASNKAAWVRVYVRSGFFAAGTAVTGKLVVERQYSVFPLQWTAVGEYTPQGLFSVTAPASADYATERGNIWSTLNFLLPAADVTGVMRVRAIIWPTAGSDADPSDTDEVTVNATLLQTLRVRGILISYNGPNAAGTVANMNLAAPTVADLQATCAQTHIVYPVENVGVYSSGGTIAWATPLTGMATEPGGCSQQWLDLNVAIAQARTNDGSRPDMLYVGLLPVGIPIANVGGCNSSGVSAVPNGQQWTMAHELGHAAGLQHGPCNVPGDASYPAYEPYDPANAPTASIGEFGLDINNGTIHPPAEKDFMSYCGPNWISLYHYNLLYNNDAFDPRWVDAPRGPDFEIPVLVDPWLWPWEYIPDPPLWDRPVNYVRPELQRVISIIGSVDIGGELTVANVMRVNVVAQVKGATATDMIAELVGEGGRVTARANVMRVPAHGCGGGCGCGCGGEGGLPRTGFAFQAFIPDVEAGSALRIVSAAERGGERKELWLRESPGDPPKVTSVAVHVGKGELHIEWRYRAACDAVDFAIQFSKDEGRSWNGLAVGIENAEYATPLADLPSGKLIFRVLAHDGFASGYADSKPVKVKARPPVVAIQHPHEGRPYLAGTPLRFGAAVNTHAGANHPRLKLAWYLDGKPVGEGFECFVTAPRPGRHECRVIASDEGGEGEARVRFVTTGEDRQESKAK